jgi:hypothetical protein
LGATSAGLRSRVQVEFFADSAPTRISRFIADSFRQNDEE